MRVTLTGDLINDGTLHNNGTLNSNSSGHLDNYGILNNNGTLNKNDGRMENDGTLTNNGWMTVDAEMNNYGTLTNSGQMTSKRTMYNEGGSTLTNNDTLNNRGHLFNIGTLDNIGTLNNSGTLNNAGTFYTYAGKSVEGSGIYKQTAGTTTINGTMTQASVDINGGSLSGSGTIQANKITIGEEATVKPGNSPGTLIMVGDVDLFGGVQTEIVSSILFDVLEVQGTVALSDTTFFDFLFDDFYMGIDGDSYNFLSASDFDFGSGAGFFDLTDMSHFNVTGLDADFGWSVSFTDNFNDQGPSYLSLNIFADNSVGNLNPNAVPAPGSLALFALALSIMGWNSRRRTKLRAHTS